METESNTEAQCQAPGALGIEAITKSTALVVAHLAAFLFDTHSSLRARCEEKRARREERGCVGRGDDAHGAHH